MRTWHYRLRCPNEPCIWSELISPPAPAAVPEGARRGTWVNLYRKEHAGEEPPLDVNELARLQEAGHELRELRMENEF